MRNSGRRFSSEVYFVFFVTPAGAQYTLLETILSFTKIHIYLDLHSNFWFYFLGTLSIFLGFQFLAFGFTGNVVPLRIFFSHIDLLL